MKKADTPLRQALWQIPFLMVITCLVALTANHWRETPLPLIGDWSATAWFIDSGDENPVIPMAACSDGTPSTFTDNEAKNLVIPLEEAKQLFQSKAAKFVDARPRSQYMDGHISGALSLPLQDALNSFTHIEAQFKSKDIIITYCDGETCKLRHDLALFLKGKGFGNVRTLVNGWTAWQEAGLPTEKAGGNDEK